MADQVAHEDVEDVFVEFGHEGQYTWAGLWFLVGQCVRFEECGGPDVDTNVDAARLEACATAAPRGPF